MADSTHPDDLAQHEVNLADVREGAVRGHEVAKWYLRPDGSAVPARVHAAVVLDRSGQPAYVFAHVLRDAAGGRSTSRSEAHDDT